MSKTIKYTLILVALTFTCLVGVSSALFIYTQKDKIISVLKGTTDEGRSRDSQYTYDENQLELAKDIMNGGYILYFRHAHREKWIDVAMYDAMEATQNINAENTYFKNAVCLSEMGLIQAKMMGEFILQMGLPYKEIITSPSCRSRQTSELVFGNIGKINNVFLHTGPYNENLDEFAYSIKKTLLDLKINKNTNTIISAHNGVIKAKVFDEIKKKIKFDLEEGGFYVIKNNNGKLILIDKFHNFQYFQQIFYPRPE